MGFWAGFWIGAASGYLLCLAAVMAVLSLCYAAGGDGRDDEGA